ncbi:ABC transporter ATP-binding protein [Hydrotalea sp.]|uniref:ABC transporter ATP-binding protein n=1 Tax=Hydrotalea sp. TaxID=2881279 RepID=UPI00263768D8|nr:ABC transporter ATP-binding protein [Hydrotalea sp.]
MVIARALALNSSLIIFDESVAALDVSAKAQILSLINDLKNEFNFTGIFISYNMGVVKYISDLIMLMNKGRIKEIGATTQIFSHPSSAYAQQLLNAIL